jgi:3-oxoacyl-[acyl-carrier protein] reductase
MPMQIDLKNRIAVVTGATGELGRVMAKTLAACGADIVVHYFKNEEKAQAILKEVQDLGVRGMTVRADVTSEKSVTIMQKAILGTLGHADIIVNNAVSQYRWTSVLEQNLEDYESQFKTCVLHNVLMAKAFVPAMVKKKRGRVIAINTECAMQLFPSQSAYVSGKRGMDGVLRVLAKEIGEHQVTVNQVAPGWTVSDRDRKNGTEKEPGYEGKVPLKRRGTDQEIANVVAFLASDLASFITGAYIPVCGGNVMPSI